MDKKIHEGTMKVGQIHGDEDGANTKENSSLILGSPTGSGWAALVLILGFNHCIFIYALYLLFDDRYMFCMLSTTLVT